MFGRQAYLPVDADFQIQSPEELCTGYFELKDPDMSSKEYQLVLEEAKQNILEAQMKQTKIMIRNIQNLESFKSLHQS